MRRAPRPRRGLHTLFFFLVLVPMLVVFPYIRTVNNPNEFVRVFTVMSLTHSHTYKIDEQVQTFGWVNDMSKRKGTDGLEHYYMVKAPAVVYAGLPGYLVFSKIVAPLMGKKYPGIWNGRLAADAAAGPSVVSTLEEKLWWLRMSTWAMRLSASQIPCFLFLLWLERYLRNFSADPAIRYAAVAAAGLGTNFLAYTHMFASHSQYAAFAFLAFATIETELRRSRGDILAMRPSRALFAGFCTSACVTLEYHALFMTIVMSLFAIFTFWSPLRALFWTVGLAAPGARRLIPLGASVTPTRVLAFAAGGLLNIPHMMYFHWSAYGNPYTPGHQQLETARFAAEHKMGLWGILWPSWEHIRALAIDPGFGLFGMSPFMWLGLLGVPLLVFSPAGSPTRRTHLRWISIVWFACMTMVIGVNAGFVEWRAGWTVGPRYLVVCAPFFAFGGVLFLERFAGKNRVRRATARGLAGGFALAGVLAIGTVGLLYDTLPETIARPFAQFSIPLIRAGLVPHHIGEWFGWSTITPWYLACGALVLAPILAGLWPMPDEGTGDRVGRASMFVVALAVGIFPAFSPPDDKSELFVLHPSVADFPRAWEPPGRDHLTHLREDAERLGSRGNGPCLWYRVADMERALAETSLANRDEARAKTVPRSACPRRYW